MSSATGGETVALVPSPPAASASEVRPETPHVRRIRRSSDRFVGRREELASTLDALLPLPAGVRRAGPGRVVTLTKEGGISKTAMAGEIADWCVERGVFSGGVYELACETYASAEAFLSRLLEVSGVPLAEQHGDLMALLRGWFSERLSAERPSLLVLDNLDDLFARASPARIEAGRLIEAALQSAPSLRVLATCRWPLSLAEHELPIEVPPLRANEARDVFIENLVTPAHQAEVKYTWRGLRARLRGLIGRDRPVAPGHGRFPEAIQMILRGVMENGPCWRLRTLCRHDPAQRRYRAPRPWGARVGARGLRGSSRALLAARATTPPGVGADLHDHARKLRAGARRRRTTIPGGGCGGPSRQPPGKVVRQPS